MDNLNYEKQNSDENSGFFKKLMKDPNYDKFYRIFKKLPKILAIINIVLFFIAAIVLASIYDMPSLVIGGWLIGAIFTLIVYFFSVLLVSATVVRTDAVLEINAKVKETPAEKQQND